MGKLGEGSKMHSALVLLNNHKFGDQKKKKREKEREGKKEMMTGILWAKCFDCLSPRCIDPATFNGMPQMKYNSIFEASDFKLPCEMQARLPTPRIFHKSPTNHVSIRMLKPT